MDDEILIGRTTREITFGYHDTTPARRLLDTLRAPAGTEVYVTERGDGTFTIRIPGTLFAQHVRATAVEPY
jgi:hypothetical protein